LVFSSCRTCSKLARGLLHFCPLHLLLLICTRLECLETWVPEGPY
jgi:hypothetical protein